jgi:transposase-like protein
MRCLIEKVVRFPRAETVWLTGPTELDLTLPDQAKFVICNHTIEEGHRSVKRVTRPMLGFKSFDAARCTLAGIELMHMLRKGQLEEGIDQGLTPAAQFYGLAA